VYHNPSSLINFGGVPDSTRIEFVHCKREMHPAP